MKISELSKALSKIERYEDDVYDVVLCVKRNHDECRMGFLFRDLPFDLLAGTVTPILNENYANEDCIIDLSQSVLYKSDLYITIFVRNTISYPDRTD